jgi:hypothetical protein
MCKQRPFHDCLANRPNRPEAALKDRPDEFAVSAHSGHSPTAWRTCQIDPELPFLAGTRYGRECAHERSFRRTQTGAGVWASNRPDQRNGSWRFTPQSRTPSTSNAISFPAIRSALSEPKRFRIGSRRPRPEHEPNLPTYVRPKPSSCGVARDDGGVDWGFGRNRGLGI